MEAGDNSGLDGMKRAANLGYAPAQTYLGQLYLDGANGVPADPVQSRQWGRRAAEGGDPRGMHLYGMQLYEGDGGATNQAEALTWLLNAAERGLPDSQYNVARIYETGADGVAKNPTEALKWYMIAARGGDSEAQAAVTRLRPLASATDQRAARVRQHQPLPAPRDLPRVKMPELLGWHPQGDGRWWIGVPVRFFHCARGSVVGSSTPRFISF